MNFFLKLFDPTGYIPRKVCGDWTLGEIALHNLSDFFIWTAYLAIPIVLFAVARKRHTALPFRRVFLLFGLFILACGTTHLMDIVVFYYPIYRFAGLVKLVTAAASWGTVIALIPLMPIALSMRGLGELEREIAERKRVEAELRASEERFEAFMQNTPAVTFMKDEEGRYVWVNERFRQSFGEATTEWIGHTDAEIWPEIAPALRAVDVEVLQSGQTREVLESTPHKGHDRQWLAFKFPVRAGDQSVLLGGVALDVTDRLQSESALQQSNEQLHRSNRELQEFAAVASHDLQEPLRKIQAFGDRLLQNHSEQLDETGRDHLRRMHAAAARMQALISDLLDFSRITTKAAPFIEVDLTQIAHEVLADLDDLVRRSEGRVEIGDLPILQADALQMRQLLQNLIGNALKFRRPDVPPLVRLYCAKQSAEEDSEKCRFVVEDNGIGMEEKYLDRIFDPFQRLHGRQVYEGTGIGLAICRKIVERHQGTVRVESEMDAGSRFIITLPCAQAQDVFYDAIHFVPTDV